MHAVSTLMHCGVLLNDATDCHTRTASTDAHTGRPDLGEKQVAPFHMADLHQPLLLEAGLLHPPGDVPEVEACGKHRQLPRANACDAQYCVCSHRCRAHIVYRVHTRVACAVHVDDAKIA